MRIVCLSDTHSHHSQMSPLPEGDILIHAGDFTTRGDFRDISSFNAWLRKQKFKYKIIVAGNHDMTFESEPYIAQSLLTDCIYLQDRSVTINGYSFYGSPWQPEFMNWAFNLPRGNALKEKWDLIPDNTDVLITHCPQKYIRDYAYYSKDHVGCEHLLERVKEIKPKLHIFGHVHEGNGMTESYGIKFINAAICDENNNVVNKPIVIDL